MIGGHAEMLNFVVFGFHQWWRGLSEKFQENFSIKFFVGLDREAGSSKLARFGIIKGSATRDSNPGRAVRPCTAEPNYKE